MYMPPTSYVRRGGVSSTRDAMPVVLLASVFAITMGLVAAQNGQFGPGDTWTSRQPNNRTAVVWFMGAKSADESVEFAQEVGSHPGYDAFIVTDVEPDNGAEWQVRRQRNVTFVRVDSKYAELAGFSHSHSLLKGWTTKRGVPNKPTLAQDKALFFLANVAADPVYSFIWLLEDDVLVPSANSFLDVDTTHPDADLLCESQESQTENPKWKHFRLRVKKKDYAIIPRPMWHTRACAIRVSNRLLGLMFLFSKEHGRLAFHEILPLTLAKHNHLQVEHPKEFHFRGVIVQGFPSQERGRPGESNLVVSPCEEPRRAEEYAATAERAIKRTCQLPKFSGDDPKMNRHKTKRTKNTEDKRHNKHDVEAILKDIVIRD